VEQDRRNRSAGIAAWKQIDDGPIVLGYHNPWRGLAGLSVGFTLLLCAVAALWGARAHVALVLLGTAAVYAALSALWLSVGERRVGTLTHELSKDHLAIGCAKDRLLVPWLALDPTESVEMLRDRLRLPIRPGCTTDLQLERDGSRISWDGTPYRRFTLEIRLIDEGRLELISFPAAFATHLAGLVVPLLASAPARLRVDRVDEKDLQLVARLS